MLKNKLIKKRKAQPGRKNKDGKEILQMWISEELEVAMLVPATIAGLWDKNWYYRQGWKFYKDKSVNLSSRHDSYKHRQC